MKAITLTQPWASLVAIGAKRIETRSWKTAYHGPLAIHAAKGFPKWARETAKDSAFGKELGPDRLPTGCIIAIATLVNCIPTDGLSSDRVIPIAPGFFVDANERLFGDFTPGRFAWLLACVKPLEKPIPILGKLGLWEWDETVPTNASVGSQGASPAGKK